MRICSFSSTCELSLSPFQTYTSLSPLHAQGGISTQTPTVFLWSPYSYGTAICTYIIKFCYFSPVNLSHDSLMITPARTTKRKGGEISVPYSTNTAPPHQTHTHKLNIIHLHIYPHSISHTHYTFYTTQVYSPPHQAQINILRIHTIP